MQRREVVGRERGRGREVDRKSITALRRSEPTFTTLRWRGCRYAQFVAAPATHIILQSLVSQEGDSPQACFLFTWETVGECVCVIADPD